MPCYADTIVRIKYVKQYEKDNNLSVVWALSAYPVEREDYNIEMTLFVSNDLNDRDFETQAIFEKDNFYSVGGKIVSGYYEGKKKAMMTVSISTHMTILNKVMASNKCPLKVSLIRIPQEIPREPKDGENSVIQTSRSALRIINFCGEQLEIIDNDFYVYARDINYINACFINKKKSSDSNLSQVSSSQSIICSKLLVTHQNTVEDSKEKIANELPASIDSNDNINNKSESHLADSFYLSKYARIEDVGETNESCLEVGEESVKDNRSQKKILYSHERERDVRVIPYV
ncbi:11550_t:CDS:2, partial [Scutellospora calospora]